MYILGCDCFGAKQRNLVNFAFSFPMVSARKVFFSAFHLQIERASNVFNKNRKRWTDDRIREDIACRLEIKYAKESRALELRAWHRTEKKSISQLNLLKTHVIRLQNPFLLVQKPTEATYLLKVSHIHEPIDLVFGVRCSNETCNGLNYFM